MNKDKLERNVMKLSVAILVGAVLAVAAASAANAATVVLDTSHTGPLAGSSVETFDGLALGTPAADTPLTGIGGATLNVSNAQIVKGSSSGQYAAPFPVGGVDKTNYLSVFGGGSATITLAHAATNLGLLWGSVDRYNSISFLDGADNVLATFTGDDFAVNDGNQSLAGTYYANISSDVAFLKVILTSASNSFEVDNIAISAVPLPAALPLFGAALAGMGVVGRKRRKAAAAA
jgi:hypothetical protein